MKIIRIGIGDGLDKELKGIVWTRNCGMDNGLIEMSWVDN